MRSKIIITALATMMALSAYAQTERTSSSSIYLKANEVPSCLVPFAISDSGKQLPVRWGMDTAWNNEQNVRKGMTHIGSDNLTIARASFQTTYALTNDESLTSMQVNALKARLANIDLYSDSCDLVLNEDQEAGIDEYYVKDGVCYNEHWAKLIAATTRWIHEHTKHRVVAISPFNEPDYGWGQGSMADFKEIARILKEEYTDFADIAIAAGNTLNCDQAWSWYNYMKPYATWGCTHQLAGSFDTYASFFSRVKDDGNTGYADELHNVGEAMVGAEYGMEIGVWWGFDARARGEFCQLSNHGSRIGYGENRSAWTSASVYRHDSTQAVRAFVGSSERQANTSTFLFVSKDREVYYDGQGPSREFLIEMPGGTGYQDGQTNAERVINVDYGEDVPLTEINGTYKIMCKASRYVVAEKGTLDGQPNISQVKYTGDATQQWIITPVDSRIGGDYSYYSIKSVNDGKYMNVLNNSTLDKANVIAYDAGGASNEQWALQYAGDGYYRLENRESGLYLECAIRGQVSGGNIRQGTYKTGSDASTQLWRILPLDADCENRVAYNPAQPTGLQAQGQSASVLLSWNANSEENVEGYNVLRAEKADGKWNVIARMLPQTSYVDNTCRQGVEYMYKIKAVNQSQSQSESSDSVVVSTNGDKKMIAHWSFDSNADDGTENLFDAAMSAKASYTTVHKEGTKALSLNGSTGFVQLPYQVADTEELTFCAWVYWRNSSKTFARIFDFGNGEDAYLFLTPNNGSNMRFAIKNGGGEQVIDCPTKLTTGSWKHVAVSMAKGKTTIYVDGKEWASSSAITITPRDIRPTLNFLGRSQFVADPLFQGYMDDVRLYNYALSTDEVTDVMNGVSDGIAVQVKDEERPSSYYQLNGVKAEQMRRGDIYIEKQTDGTAKKVLKR